MKILTLSLLAAVLLAGAAEAKERYYLFNLDIIYARGAGITSSADKQDKHEKRSNRLGTGLLIYGSFEPVSPVPLPKRRR